MKKITLYIGILFFANSKLFSQSNKINEIKSEEKHPFSIGFGGVLSSVNVARNYKENPYHLGWSSRIIYNYSDNFRFVAEYSHIPKFDLTPTWLEIKNNSVAISVNAIAHVIHEDVMIYTISGVCVQSWKGFYTGIQDFSTAHFYYQENTYVRNRNVCLDLGLGFEHPFPGFNLFGDFRYRFATIDNRFGIIDALYNLGINFPINTKFFKNKNKSHKHKSSKFFDKYHWF